MCTRSAIISTCRKSAEISTIAHNAGNENNSHSLDYVICDSVILHNDINENDSHSADYGKCLEKEPS